MHPTLGLIGNTPLFRTTRLSTGPCTLSLKLEDQNPSGSIKDRIALSMIEAAERDGTLQPGGTVVEATAGNTGLGLALVGTLKGYRVVLVVPDKMAREKILHLRALGAEIITTRSDVARGHPEYYQDVARRVVENTPGAFWANQFSNPANPAAHERGTGPEILADCAEQPLDAFVAGVGSGGTVTGCARAFKNAGHDVRIIVADPEGSVIAGAVEHGEVRYEGGSWLVEGIGEDFIPDNLDLELVDEAVTVPDAQAFDAIHQLLRLEGLLAGSSSGTLIAAALAWCQRQTEPKHVVTFVCDTGNKYLGRAFDDAWRRDEGLLPPLAEGRLAALLNRRADRGDLVTVSPEDTLATAYRRMRMADVSQLPVLEQNTLVGLLDETDLLNAATAQAAEKNDAPQAKGDFTPRVATAMVRSLERLQADGSLEDLQAVLSRGLVGIVMQGDTFLGLLTRSDLLAALARDAD